MKKLIVGVVAVGAVMALRPVLMRRMVQTLRKHCTQMGAHCREMMGAQPGSGEASGEATVHQKMREHCEQMAANDTDRAEPVATA